MSKHARTVPAANSPTKAQAAFDDYRKRMDEGFQKHVAEGQKASPPAGAAAIPVFAIPAPPAAASADSGGSGAPASTPASAATIFDNLATLLDLSVRTVNSTLGGWLNVMDRFYGGEHRHGSCEEEECDCRHGMGYDCDCGCDCHCHDEHACHDHHHERQPWDHCHTGVRNCC